MSGSNGSAVVAADELCRVLDQLGNALAEVNLEMLLQTEQRLSHALRALQLSDWQHRDQRFIGDLVERGRSALLRCRRLGASFSAIAAARVQACSGSDAYNRDGYVNRPSISTVKVVG
jgi:hypothetical protein